MSHVYLKAHVELARVPIFILLIFVFFIFIYGFKNSWHIIEFWTCHRNARNLLEFIARRRKSTMEDAEEKKMKLANRTGWIFCSLCARVRTIGRSWGPWGHGLAHGAPWGPQREVSVLSFILIMRPGHRRLYIKENNHRNRA